MIAAHAALEVLQRARVDELTPAQDGGVVADLVDVAQVVAGNDQRLVAAERLDQLEHAAAGLDVQAVRWLVPDQQVGFVDQAGGDGQAGRHAIGEAGDRLARGRQQIDRPNERSQPRLAGVGRQAEQPGDVVEVRNRGHAARELRIGRDVADAAADPGGIGRH